MMSLTAELLDRFHTANPRPIMANTTVRMTDDEVEAFGDELIARGPAGGPLRVFAYGSLLWNPAFEADTEEHALALGWHRAFRMKQTSWRGSPDNPGLMMVLDRGGSCRGISMYVEPSKSRAAITALIRREMGNRASANQPRWISVDVGGRRTTALAFCIDRASEVYSRRQTEEAVADTLARAIGPAGSCAEYLLRTVAALDERKIRDRSLIRLQALVAQRLLDAHPAQGPTIFAATSARAEPIAPQ
jgi:cation transport protein ChaC